MIRGKEGHSIMIKESVPQEVITISGRSASNTEIHKAKLVELQGKR